MRNLLSGTMASKRSGLLPQVTSATSCSNHSAIQVIRPSNNGVRICSLLARLAEGGRCLIDRTHSSWCCSLFATWKAEWCTPKPTLLEQLAWPPLRVQAGTCDTILPMLRPCRKDRHLTPVEPNKRLKAGKVTSRQAPATFSCKQLHAQPCVRPFFAKEGTVPHSFVIQNRHTVLKAAEAVTVSRIL